MCEQRFVFPADRDHDHYPSALTGAMRIPDQFTGLAAIFEGSMQPGTIWVAFVSFLCC